MSISEISPATAVKKPRSVGAPAFKINRAAATSLRGKLRHRVIVLRFISVLLILSALSAVAAGIALIYYAGDLVANQRSAGIDILLRADEQLRLQRQQAESDLNSIAGKNEANQLLFERATREKDKTTARIAELRGKR